MKKNYSEFKAAEMNGQFRVCPECGYERGFHLVLERTGRPNEAKLLLICPNCGVGFDLGLTGRITKDGPS